MRDARLIVLRCDSASGKSGTAWHVQAMADERPAIISRDTVRTSILAEADVHDGGTITPLWPGFCRPPGDSARGQHPVGVDPSEPCGRART
ncbi:hypothetical protein ACFCX4_31305 [Kitasatospora sp. NPDC056327]|uniref:hypothetical protein n=1 Tax=Kitasatospora sp. NPDC056327 TaxID=3345785 RepID=UPI0035E152FF